jgi:hypothetical protein
MNQVSSSFACHCVIVMLALSGWATLGVAAPGPDKTPSDPAQNAVVAQCDATIAVFETGIAKSCVLLDVPSGKRLVIEQASARCQTDTPDIVNRITLLAGFEGFIRSTYLVVVPQFVVGSFSTFAASQALRAYADPLTGGPVTMAFSRNAGSDTGTICQFTISGYLVTR